MHQQRQKQIPLSALSPKLSQRKAHAYVFSSNYVAHFDLKISKNVIRPVRGHPIARLLKIQGVEAARTLFFSAHLILSLHSIDRL